MRAIFFLLPILVWEDMGAGAKSTAHERRSVAVEIAIRVPASLKTDCRRGKTRELYLFASLCRIICCAELFFAHEGKSRVQNWLGARTGRNKIWVASTPRFASNPLAKFLRCFSADILWFCCYCSWLHSFGSTYFHIPLPRDAFGTPIIGLLLKSNLANERVSRCRS